MKLREITKRIISQLEEISGYAVQVVEDKNLPVPASLRIARGQIPAHILSFKGADPIYIQVIGMDEFNEIAELARKARSRIAEQGFHAVAGEVPRMDAVMYCLSALQHFEKLSLEQVRQIGFEIALLGTRGLDVNSSEEQYTLKSMEGNFSGLHLVCIQYVAFKKIAPEHSIGFDLSAEYRTALGLFGEKKND